MIDKDLIVENILDNLGLCYFKNISKLYEFEKELHKDYLQSNESGMVAFLSRQMSICDLPFKIKYSKYMDMPTKDHCIEDIEQMTQYKRLDGKPLFKNVKNISTSKLKQIWFGMIAKEILYGVKILDELNELSVIDKNYVMRKVVNMR